MHEVLDDKFYDILKEYNRLVVDYFLIENESFHQGYQCHKKAIIQAMNSLKERYSWITIEENQAVGEKITSKSLFVFSDYTWKKNDGGKIPYWYAFAKPPHGTGSVMKNGSLLRKKYGKEDFELINQALFPQGKDELEVYEWSTDWSNYFDAGQEWWGTMCFSIYDWKMNRYVVMMASETD